MILNDKTKSPKYETIQFSSLCKGDTFFVDDVCICSLYMRIARTNSGNAVDLYSGEIYNFNDTCEVIAVDSCVEFSKRFENEVE